MDNQYMLDINLIRENPEKVKRGIASKNVDERLVDDFLRVDEKWRGIIVELDAKRSLQKKLSNERNIESARKNKEEIKELESALSGLEKEREDILMKIPNLPEEDVPLGKDESENVVLRSWGSPQKFGFKALDHIEIGEKLGIIDTERASKISGARFGYLIGEAALLEFALVQHSLSILTNMKILKKLANKIKKGYSAKSFIPVIPPVMIRPDVFQKMARLEPKEERYYIPSDDLYLVGSAEHTLGPLHMNETISEENLPLRYVGFSTSFRREAGSYGKDMKGLLRVHQFNKMEIESFTSPDDSRNEQDFIISIQEYITQSLGLPYRVISICTGDMGGPDARQIDIETWMPSQDKYRETHTSDMMTDYQARRLGTKVREDKDKTDFVHMNDATVFAGRTIIAILENYQTKDGKVKIPKVLQKYIGKKEIG